MLDAPALVLNRSWLPISTTPVRRAVLLMARGAAGAVHPDTFEVAGWDAWVERGPLDALRIRGVDFEFPVPEVIVLHAYDAYPDLPIAFTRRNVHRRDGWRCVYCGTRPRSAQLTIDHVVPRARGGESSWENCVSACRRCNARKADRTPRDAGLKLSTLPSPPRWPGGLDPELLARRPVWRRFVTSRSLRRAAGQ